MCDEVCECEFRFSTESRRKMRESKHLMDTLDEIAEFVGHYAYLLTDVIVRIDFAY